MIHREVLADESANAGLPRCSYELTESGHELEMVIAAIREWAIAHLEPGAD